MQKATIQFECLFVRFFSGVAKASGKPFRILELSNGVRSKVFGTSLDEDSFSSFAEGAPVSVTVEFDLFSEQSRATVVAIS